ncbi:MAG: aldose 1-epimerase family protein [Gemmatimonadota bacterium]
MAEPRSYVLTDAEHRVWVDSLELSGREIGAADAAVRKVTLRGGLGDGVDAIEVNNGELSFTVLPTRGMGIWKGRYRGLELGWRAPIPGPVHPKFVNLQDRGGLGWISGFDEVIVRCGLDSNGAPTTDIVPNNMGVPSEVELTLHGRIANLPASRVEVQVLPGDPPEIVVLGDVYEATLFFPCLHLHTAISTRCGSNTFTIMDSVTNLKATEAEMELLYHCNFGPPFLGAGSRLEIPARMVAPRDPRAVEGIADYATYLGPTAGYVEQAYWFEPLARASGNTLALLRTATGDRGVAVRFNTRELPAFTQWKNTAAVSDGYVTGLEPGTDYPNTKTFERQQGRVVRLAPGEIRTAHLTIEVCDTATGVEGLRDEIAAIQGDVPLIVHPQPLPGLSG